jgi:hypothetical protein
MRNNPDKLELAPNIQLREADDHFLEGRMAKSIALILSFAISLSLAVSGTVISGAFAPASASKMDGKGYGSSDRGIGAKARQQIQPKQKAKTGN